MRTNRWQQKQQTYCALALRCGSACGCTRARRHAASTAADVKENRRLHFWALMVYIGLVQRSIIMYVFLVWRVTSTAAVLRESARPLMVNICLYSGSLLWVTFLCLFFGLFLSGSMVYKYSGSFSHVFFLCLFLGL